MSAEEMREYCLRLQEWRLKVNVRMKNEQATISGRISAVDKREFSLTTDSETRVLPFAWVAKISNG
jgi:hypothetical protein